MIFRFVDGQLQHASHGRYYSLGAVSVVDSELLGGSFTTDYHDDLRVKNQQEKAAQVTNAMSPFHSPDAYFKAKHELDFNQMTKD